MRPFLILTSLLCLVATSPGRRAFVDVRSASGVDFVTESGDPDKRAITSSLGGGAGLLDYDADGDLDLFLMGSGRDALYRNEGSWRFVDVTAAAGLDHHGSSIGCAAGDFDNDGLADLFVTRIGANVLYRNRGDGTFEDVTEAQGVRGTGFGTSALFFDADGDGDLDLYVAGYVAPAQPFPAPGSGLNCQWLGLPVMCGPRGLEGSADVFYRNDEGELVEATDEAGMRDEGLAFGLGVVSADFDDDGDLDLYVSNDTNPNFLYHNLGGGKFEDLGLLAGAAYNRSGATEAGMGVDFGDANGDGWLDLFVTNFSHETNTLYLGSATGFFVDATDESGLATPSLGKLGWGTRFVDLDLDGDLDLFVANGHVYPNVAESDATTSYLQSDQIFWNDGTGLFADSGLVLDSAEGLRSSRGAAFGDIDDDGDVDVVVAAIDDQPALLRNDLGSTSGARWLGLRLVGRASDRDGTGARLRLLTRDRAQLGLAHASGSIFSSSDPRVLFGLGEATEVEAVEIRWLSGETTRLVAPELDRYWVVIEGQTSAFASQSAWR